MGSGHEKKILPGAGTFVAAIETVSGRKPLIVAKPHAAMFDAIVQDHHIDKNRTIIIGDK
jgi:ribonucleotide monophosphatase NagD (HAD superfamily)